MAALNALPSYAWHLKVKQHFIKYLCFSQIIYVLTLLAFLSKENPNNDSLHHYVTGMHTYVWVANTFKPSFIC